jgi:hypothetical protein
MGRINPKNLKQSLTVAIFLGGITLAVLTYLFQAKVPSERVLLLDPMDYKRFIISVTGVASTLLLVSIFGMKVAIVHEETVKEWFSKLVLYCYEAGYIALLVLLPLLVMPFFQPTAWLIVGIEIAWGIIVAIEYKKRRS